MKTSDGVVTIGGEAMATSFRIRIADISEQQARQAAAAAWADLARLEGLLSRYIESSDVIRLNRAPAGEPVRINADTLRCLELALRLSDLTKNAFNPLLGAWTSGRPPAAPSIAERPAAAPDSSKFVINGSDFTATRTDDQVLLDLGGIGKGFALDAIGSLLREWDVPAACVDAGGSTALAFGRPERAPPWLARVGEQLVPLQNAAVAGSGTTVKGDHIVDGRTGRDLSHHRYRAWSTAPTATEADALSTAFFVLLPEDIRDVCSRHPQYGAAWQTPGGRIHAVGRWTKCLEQPKASDPADHPPPAGQPG